MAAAPAPLSPDELHAILTAFPNRWLLASELHRLLHGFAAAGVPVLQAVVRRPPSGSFFLYDASLRVRDDGYEYTRKQLAGGRREIKESYVKLVVQGVPRLACFTSELEERPSFRRRIYRLLDADGDGSGGAAVIQLVHYLDVEAAAAAAKAGGGGKRAEETAHRPPSTSYVSGCPLCGGPNPVLAPLPAVSGSSFHFSAAIGSARPAARPPDLPRRIPGLTSSSDDDGMPPSTAAAPPLPRTPPSGLPSLSALDPGTGTGPFDDWDLGAHLSGDLGIYVEDTPVGSAAVPPGTGPLAAASQWGGTHPILQPASANVAPFPATLQPVTGGTHGGGDWAAASASVSASTEDDAGVSDAESDTHQTGTGSAPPSTVEGRTNRLLQRLMAQMATLAAAVGEAEPAGEAAVLREAVAMHTREPSAPAASTVYGSATSGRRSRRRLDDSLSAAPQAVLMAGVDSAAKDATSEHLLAPAAAALDESAFSGRVFAHGSVPGHSQTHNQRLRQGGATSYRRRGGTSHRSTSSAVAASVIGGGDSFSVASDANRSATRARLAQQESRIGDSASTNSPVTAATDADTGETLLHLAAQAGSATLVSALLRAGADSAAVDALGRTPLDLAAAALERTAGSPASARYDATVRALAHGGSLHVRLQNNAMDTTGTLAIDAAPSLSAADRRMLVDAFTALSLRDKCAVSLALGTAPPSAPPTTLAPATTLGAGATALATPSSPPQRDRGGVASGGGYIASGSASHSRGHHRSLSETGSTDDPQSLHAHAQAQAMLRSLRLDAPTPAADTSKRKRVEDALAEPAQSELEPMPPGPRAAINVPTSETQSVAHALALMSAEEVLDCKAEALRIQTNVRSWLVRRHFRQLREATRTVQAAIRRTLARRRGGAGGVPGEGGDATAVGTAAGPPPLEPLQPQQSLRSLTGASLGTSSRELLPAIPEDGRAAPEASAAFSAAPPARAAVKLVPPLVGAPATLAVVHPGWPPATEPQGSGDATAAVAAVAGASRPWAWGAAEGQRSGGSSSSSGGGVPGPPSSPPHPLSPAPLPLAGDLPRTGGTAATASALRSLQRSRRQAEAAAVIARSLRRWVAAETGAGAPANSPGNAGGDASGAGPAARAAGR